MTGDTAQTLKPVGGHRYLWPLALVLIMLGFAFWGDRGILHMVKLSNQKDALEQKVADIKSQNEALRAEITSLRGDRRYIEHVARTELGMVREDERVFQFADDK